MKRENNLFRDIVSNENLERAINEVCKSHRWRSKNNPNTKVLWIECTKEERIKELRKIIIEGFEATEPKEKKRYDVNARKWRIIHEPLLWPDQFVHHALIQILEPVMMRGMDPWCCGSIKGRGAIYGVKALKRWVNKDRKGTKYCAELDIHHFYDSLNPEVVMYRFRYLVKDHKTLDLIQRVMKFNVSIGAYFSQWFANTTLQPLDHMIRESDEKISHYTRYIDNITIFSNRKRHLEKMIVKIEKWLNDHGLKLNANTQCFKTKDRLPNALGYRYGHGYTLIRKNGLLTIKRQIAKYKKAVRENKKIKLKFAQSLLSRLGRLKYCNNFNITQKYVPKGMVKILKNIIRKDTKKNPQIPWEECINDYLIYQQSEVKYGA